MHLDWWNLPGPSAWLESLLRALRAGHNLIIRLPDYSPLGLREALERQVTTGGSWRWTPIQLGISTTLKNDPAQFLWQRFGGEKTHVLIDSVTLARSKHLLDYIIWLEGFTQDSWCDWQKFLFAYSDACRERDPVDRGLFVACCDGMIGKDIKNGDAALSVHTFYGATNSLDMSLWVANLLQGRHLDPLEIRLRTAVIVELAGCDSDIAQALVALDLDKLFDPWSHLASIGNSRHWSVQDPSVLSDYSGMIHLIDGHPHINSSLLAINGSEGTTEIRRRIWQGQVSILFPFLEQERISLLNRLKPLLRIPFSTKFGEVNDIWELELMHILQQVKQRVKSDLRQRLQNLVDMRNALAHLDLVTSQQVKVAMAWKKKDKG